MKWPKYWSFSFSISPSNEHPGLISFRMDWLDLLAVQGTFKSLLQCQIIDHRKSKRIPENIYFFFIDYAKAFDCVNHSKLWKILQEMGIPDHFTCLLRNLYAGQEAKLELDMEQQTGSKLGKEYIKAVYCHPAYLTSMQSTS